VGSSGDQGSPTSNEMCEQMHHHIQGRLEKSDL
jgi:hypothetical protein